MCCLPTVTCGAAHFIIFFGILPVRTELLAVGESVGVDREKKSVFFGAATTQISIFFLSWRTLLARMFSWKHFIEISVFLFFFEKSCRVVKSRLVLMRSAKCSTHTVSLGGEVIWSAILCHQHDVNQAASLKTDY